MRLNDTPNAIGCTYRCGIRSDRRINHPLLSCTHSLSLSHSRTYIQVQYSQRHTHQSSLTLLHTLSLTQTLAYIHTGLKFAATDASILSLFLSLSHTHTLSVSLAQSRSHTGLIFAATDASLNQSSISLCLFCHDPLKRDQLDYIAIDCTYRSDIRNDRCITQSIIYLYMSLLARSVEKRPTRLRLQSAVHTGLEFAATDASIILLARCSSRHEELRVASALPVEPGCESCHV